MQTLELFAKLAQAYKATTGNEVALLLRRYSVTLLARGTHPAGETATTAHTAAVNIMQNVDARDFRCLVTYTPTEMCHGMAHNLNMAFVALTDDLAEGDDVEVGELPNPVTKGADFLKQARKFKGEAKAVFDAFNSAAPFTNRLILSANLRNALALLPNQVPFRWAPKANELVNTYMGLACSMVAMTWNEKNMHAKNLQNPEKLIGNNVGAVIVHKNQVIAWGLNFGAEHVTLHAETVAIQEYLARTGETALPNNCVIYSSLQPCHMCAGFIAQCCPNATAIYALRDGYLTTCLNGRESRWNHNIADELGEAIRVARSIGEQHSTIHYLKGEEIKERYQAGLALVESNPSDEDRLKDLKAHCLEVLRNVALGGMATGTGIDVLAVAIDAESLVQESVVERELQVIDELIQKYRAEAQELHRKAAKEVSSATAHYTKATKLAATLNSQIAVIDQFRKDAERARDSARTQTSSKAAQPFVDAANNCIKRADTPHGDAIIAHGNLMEALKEAKELLANASITVQQADNAVSLAAQNRSRLPDSRQGGTLTSLEKKSTEISVDIQNLTPQVASLVETAEHDLQQVKHQMELTSAAASSAHLARVALIQLNELNTQKLSAEKEASGMTPEMIEALETELGLQLQQYSALRAQVEKYGSDRAKALAIAALEQVEISVEEARERLAAAKAAAMSGVEILTGFDADVTSLRQASSESAMKNINTGAKVKTASMKEKRKLFDQGQQEFQSSLFAARKLMKDAEEPIKCSSCQRLLVTNTSEKTRWHQCAGCSVYYCNTCGYNLTRSGFFTPERKCDCGSSTVLI